MAPGPMTTGDVPREERLIRLLAHLGVRQAHVAASWTQDYQGLLAARPDLFASLTLVGPRMDLDVGALEPLASRVLLVHGDRGPNAPVVPAALARLSEAAQATLQGYEDTVWADVVADRTREVGDALLAFLAAQDRGPAPPPIGLPPGRGEVAGVTYQSRGSGPPLVLLPLGLAPSQWEPLLNRLAKRYCTIVLGGAFVGPVALLEERGRSSGYVRMFRTLLDEIALAPGERVLEVGCGSGVLMRWLARRTAGTHGIVGVDINAYLLREAEALAQRAGLTETLVFRPGRAEDLPLPSDGFDAVLSVTAMEECDAERMLAEMIRVAKPGGRVAAIVRSEDVPGWVDLPLPTELRAKVTFPFPSAGRSARGCVDAGLYALFRAAGLTELKLWPHLVTYDPGPRLQMIERGMRSRLSPAEATVWRAAAERAVADHTFLVAQPFHCAVGTKR